MNEKSYITLLDWMVSILKLSSNELIIYGIIHGFSQDGKSAYIGTTSYLSSLSGASLRCVKDILEKLVTKGYLIKKDAKETVFMLPDGTTKVRRAQGGANHFCRYYTAISRNQKVLTNIDKSKANVSVKYITILNWMVEVLHLNGNELIIYAIIHGFSQDGVSVFWGSLEYLSDISGASNRCVKDVLDKLVKKGFLIKRITKKRLISNNDGEPNIQKAQGGANHFCQYYTAISRNKMILSEFHDVNNKSENDVTSSKKTANLESEKPSAKIAYGKLKPTANSALGVPSANSAYGLPIASRKDEPIANSALGNLIPSAKIAYAPSANSASVASANSAYNNKYNKKEYTTTNQYNFWNTESLDFLLDSVFGSGCSLFQSTFKIKLCNFLNINELNLSSAESYLQYSYEQAQKKATKDKLGYFISVVIKDTFYAQFKFYHKENEKKLNENIIHCPICNCSFDKHLPECPNCHNDINDFSNTEIVSLKKRIWNLPTEKRIQLEDEVKNIGTSLFSISGFQFNQNTTIDEIEKQTNEIYKKFGVL